MEFSKMNNQSNQSIRIIYRLYEVVLWEYDQELIHAILPRLSSFHSDAMVPPLRFC